MLRNSDWLLCEAIHKRNPDLVDEDAVPEAPEHPVTRSGDLWILGNHRLLCGDATRKADVDHLMDGYQADLVLADPPYGISYVGETRDALTIQNDDLKGEDFYQFLLAAHQNMFSVAKEGAGIYVFHADSEGLNFRRILIELGLHAEVFQQGFVQSRLRQPITSWSLRSALQW